MFDAWIAFCGGFFTGAFLVIIMVGFLCVFGNFEVNNINNTENPDLHLPPKFNEKNLEVRNETRIY